MRRFEVYSLDKIAIDRAPSAKVGWPSKQGYLRSASLNRKLPIERLGQLRRPGTRGQDQAVTLIPAFVRFHAGDLVALGDYPLDLDSQADVGSLTAGRFGVRGDHLHGLDEARFGLVGSHFVL